MRQVLPLIFLFDGIIEVSREIGCYLEDAPDLSPHEYLAHEMGSVFNEEFFKIFFVIKPVFLWQTSHCLQEGGLKEWRKKSVDLSPV